MTNTATAGSTGQSTTSIQPKLTAEQALTRLLELIRTTHSIQDFTPKKLTEVFGQELWADGPDRYGFGEQITQRWSHGWEVYKNPLEGMQFSFSFTPLPPGTFQDMTDICQIDFDQFGAALKTMGFSKTPDYGEHGRLMNHTFDRPGMRVKLYPRGEANEPPEKIAHDCVEMVIIS